MNVQPRGNIEEIKNNLLSIVNENAIKTQITSLLNQNSNHDVTTFFDNVSDYSKKFKQLQDLQIYFDDVYKEYTKKDQSIDLKRFLKDFQLNLNKWNYFVHGQSTKDHGFFKKNDLVQLHAKILSNIDYLVDNNQSSNLDKESVKTSLKNAFIRIYPVQNIDNIKNEIQKILQTDGFPKKHEDIVQKTQEHK